MAKRFGRYEVLERLSKGGMAEVYKGRSSGAAGFEKVVAIKRILPTLSGDPMFVAMFVEEAKLSANLNHVNIAQIYEFGELDGQYFIAMEYVHGKDLRALQRHFRQSGASMPIPMAVRIALDICSALDYAHNRRDATGSLLRIVHRDISPPNILISYEGAVKLIDFGIAKALTRTSSTATGILKGKLGYLSPEQAEGRELDGRSDIFALGTVLWELLTGVRLFHEATDMATLMKVRRAEVAPPSELNPEVPAGLDAIVLNALSREADKRFQRADLFYEALERVARQPGLNFGAIQLGRFMAGTFPSAIDDATSVATPSPSPLRVEVLSPEPLDAPSTTPDPGLPRVPTPPRPRPSEQRPSEQRTPTPIRKSEQHTPAPVARSEQRTPTPIRKSEHRPEARPPHLQATGPLPIQPQLTGPLPALEPEPISSVSSLDADLDPSTRVSEESAELAKKLTPPVRPREDRTGPVSVPGRSKAPSGPAPRAREEASPRPPLPPSTTPSRKPRRPDGIRGGRPLGPRPAEPLAARPSEARLPVPEARPLARPPEAHLAPRPPEARPRLPAPRPPEAAGPRALPAKAISPIEPEEDWEDGPTTLKEEPAVAAIVSALAAGEMIPLDERQPVQAAEPTTAEVLFPGERRAPSAQERPLDLGEMIESAISDPPAAAASWPEPMEAPELEVVPRVEAAPRVEAPPPAALPPPPASPVVPPGPPPRHEPYWEDGPTRFEPEGSPAMAAELGAEHAIDEADKMVLAPPATGEDEQGDLPEPGLPQQLARAPRWPWVILVIAALALTTAVVLLVARLRS